MRGLPEELAQLAGLLQKMEVLRDELAALRHALVRVKGIGRGIRDVVEHFVDRRRGDVHPRVGRRVVDEDVAVGASHDAVAEEHVGHIAHALFALRRHQIATRTVGHLRRVFEVR